MNEKQRQKRNFRSSKLWKSFRHIKWKEQEGRCALCGRHLTKSSNLHHLDLNPDHYQNLSNTKNFIYVCKSCHEMIHSVYNVYSQDSDILLKFKEILDYMLTLNK